MAMIDTLKTRTTRRAFCINKRAHLAFAESKMSRSGYSDDYDYMDLYRHSVERALAGARGQAFLKKLLGALDAMPVKRLIANAIANDAGEVCALGSVDPRATVDPEDRHAVGKHFGIAPSMAAEIAYVNDEDDWLRRDETPEQRWTRVRAWVEAEILAAPADK